MTFDGTGAALPELCAQMTGAWAECDAATLLKHVFALDRRIAVVSSFGTEAAVLIALVAQAKPDAEIIFVDTLRHFGETHRYREKLSAMLGLTNVRVVKPDAAELLQHDPNETLFQKDSDACCRIRKVDPLRKALEGVEIWITGRKRYQADTRAAMPKIEWVGERIKINPLADWTVERIVEEFRSRGLPAHPLEADGFLSIGCMPCTRRVAPGESHRGGRWSDLDKTECGIHTDV